MESITINITTSRTVMLQCPYCQFVKNISLDQLGGVKHSLVVRCKCKKRFAVHLNFRKCYRKNVNISGKFMTLTPNVSPFLDMTVCDLSKNGIAFKMFSHANIEKSDTLRVVFTLDNSKQTAIDKKVIVRDVRNDIVGCEFTELDLYERELGFYLMA